MTTTPRVAFWLIPGAADHGWLSVRIAGLAARHGGPVFEPHTTLHVGPVAAGCDVDLLLAAFAARWPPIELEAGPTGQSDVYFKALFSELRADRQDGPILAAMQQAIASACLSDETGEHVPEAIRHALAGYPLQPHLSLLYGCLPSQLRERLARDEDLRGRALRFDTIAAVRPIPGHADLSRVAHWDVFGHRRLTGARAS